MGSARMELYHLAPLGLTPGSQIVAGRYGRLLQINGWNHPNAYREMHLEDVRRKQFPDRPSRLQASFAFLSFQEAIFFRHHFDGFRNHHLYMVELANPKATSFITYYHWINGWAARGHLMLDPSWPERYWTGTSAVPPIGTGPVPRDDFPLRLDIPAAHHKEFLTLSDLIIIKQID